MSTQSNRSKSAKSAKSKGSAKGRHNKIYRTPPTPPPEELLSKEKGFVLDNNAVASISMDYCKANPKLGPVIPPFNSQRCRHSANYFRFHGVDRTLRKTGQVSKVTVLLLVCFWIGVKLHYIHQFCTLTYGGPF